MVNIGRRESKAEGAVEGPGLHILGLFQKASLEPEQEATYLLRSLAKSNLTLPPHVRLQYDAIIRESIQGAKTRVISDEEQNTREAFEIFSEVIAEHTTQEHKKLSNNKRTLLPRKLNGEVVNIGT